MKRPLLFVMIAALAGGALGSGVAARADLPPLIDRALIYDDPEISGAQLSPDGLHMSFVKPYKSARNIWVKGLGEPFSAARPLTADKRPVTTYFWSQDSKYVLYTQDKGGNENFHVYAVDPSATADPATGVPAARDLTPLENVRALIYAVPEDQPEAMIVGLNDRDAAYHDIYRVTIATGNRELMFENTERISSWMCDRSGRLRFAYRQKEDGGGEILRADAGKLVRIYETTYLEAVSLVDFDKDEKRVYIKTNKGDDVDLARLEIMDPGGGVRSREAGGLRGRGVRRADPRCDGYRLRR